MKNTLEYLFGSGWLILPHILFWYLIGTSIHILDTIFISGTFSWEFFFGPFYIWLICSPAILQIVFLLFNPRQKSLLTKIGLFLTSLLVTAITCTVLFLVCFFSTLLGLVVSNLVYNALLILLVFLYLDSFKGFINAKKIVRDIGT